MDRPRAVVEGEDDEVRRWTSLPKHQLALTRNTTHACSFCNARRTALAVTTASKRSSSTKRRAAAVSLTRNTCLESTAAATALPRTDRGAAHSRRGCTLP